MKNVKPHMFDEQEVNLLRAGMSAGITFAANLLHVATETDFKKMSESITAISRDAAKMDLIIERILKYMTNGCCECTEETMDDFCLKILQEDKLGPDDIGIN